MTEDYRRARRVQAPENIEVLDTMTDRVIGHVGNLSETGMLLTSGSPLVDDALYQLRFELPDGTGSEPIEVGAHLLWQNMASAPGQTWAGFRFITLSESSQACLRAWLGPSQ
ncbi:PilZ domain-containing protein [Aerolutibacter ruishenii]|uniref:PilZ domain-containing protein n=1 Tax=Aerolutibacter ruishenii TaxID=686800 RepID=A0A562LK01_9GAMM|nr:PilZ domain-containing protein [Lysobacter ruishenii]TWI07921.1 PilZ domain-containing protein [Lysobacter ruishenii]